MRSINRLVLLLIILAAGNEYLMAQIVPSDIVTIEAMIEAHKKKHKALKNRQEKESLNMGLSVSVKKITKDLNELKKLTSKRFELGYLYIGYIAETTEISLMLKEAISLSVEYTDFIISNTITSPLIIKYYLKSYDGIQNEIEGCIKLITLTNLIKSTHKQKYEILMQLKASLVIVNYMMRRTLFMCKGIVALDLSYSESFGELIDDSEFQMKVKNAAQKIILTYGNK